MDGILSGEALTLDDRLGIGDRQFRINRDFDLSLAGSGGAGGRRSSSGGGGFDLAFSSSYSRLLGRLFGSLER